MKGKEILDAVKLLIDDESYATYFDLNRAYRKICAAAPHRFLRKTSTELAYFVTDTSQYTLNLSDVDELEAIYIRGGVTSGTRVSPVVDKDLTAPPTGGSHGARYIVAGLGGAWSGFTVGDIATLATTSGSDVWSNSTPDTFDITYVQDEDRHYRYDGTSWVVVERSIVGWTELAEVSSGKYEQLKTAGTNTDGTLVLSEPKYYKWIGGPVATLSIHPAPDQGYDVRVDYVARPEDVTAETVPLIPIAFHDMLVTMTGAMALQRSSNGDKVARGDRLMFEANQTMGHLLDHSVRNKQSIDRQRRPSLR